MNQHIAARKVADISQKLLAQGTTFNTVRELIPEFCGLEKELDLEPKAANITLDRVTLEYTGYAYPFFRDGNQRLRLQNAGINPRNIEYIKKEQYGKLEIGLSYLGGRIKAAIDVKTVPLPPAI